MKKYNIKTIRNPQRTMKVFLLLMAVIVTVLIQKNAFANSNPNPKGIEKATIPNGSTMLLMHDLGSARPSLFKQYEVYSDKTGAKLLTYDNWIKYSGKAANDKNGIKIEITNYLPKESSGSFFGGSIQTQVDNWTYKGYRENSSKLFFEVYDKNGKLKSTVQLGSIKPKKDNSNLTTKAAKIGQNWSYDLLKGEGILKYDVTDRVYICVTQKNRTHSYDKLCVWYYEDANKKDMPAALTNPLLNSKGDALEFNLDNQSKKVKKYYFVISSYDKDKLLEEKEYVKTIPVGSKGTELKIPAKPGDIINIHDGEGLYYAKDYELRANIWVGTWGSAQLTASGNTMPPKLGLAGNTYRQSVRVSTGGDLLRITFSNEYGRTPLEINSTYIAKLLEYGTSKIDPKTNTLVTFNGGMKKVTIPAGKTVTSDAISYSFDALDYIAVSTNFGKIPSAVTSHTASRSTNYLMAGNKVKEEEFKNYQTATSWYFLSDIDVLSSPESSAVVCIGDSITDGYGVQTDVIQRWSDILAERLQEDPSTRNISVINKGIGGNSIFGGNGPATYKRFFRDVCQPAGVKYCIMLIGVNDIGAAKDDISDSLILKYKEMIATAHEHGIKVYGGTITPFEGNGYYSVLHEQIRQKVNKWILSKDSGFDGVIDFAAAIADPAKPSKMLARFSNDYLHPNALGYANMAEIIDLTLFTED